MNDLENSENPFVMELCVGHEHEKRNKYSESKFSLKKEGAHDWFTGSNSCLFPGYNEGKSVTVTT